MSSPVAAGSDRSADREAPAAIWFDLDDTLVDETRHAEGAWREVCDDVQLRQTLIATERWYWSDAERHARGRLDLRAARLEIVSHACALLGRTSDDSAQLAARYDERRDAQLRLMPGARELLARLRARGLKLGLVTNGAAVRQRAKLARFRLTGAFDELVIESEVGFGKPDPRIYAHLLERLAAPARSTWIVGDDLEWEVAAPQKHGLYTVWLDRGGRGLPTSCTTAPQRVITSLAELLP